MRVLLAFDKFKDSLTADQACEIAAAALRSAAPQVSIDRCPLADGGEGFAPLLTQSAAGELRSVAVTGPRGARHSAVFGLVRADRIPAAARADIGLATASGTVALLEMAAASGLSLLPPDERDVWQTATNGTGELIAAAADAGATTIVLGVGGSATNDLGLGALSALGLEPRGTDGSLITPPVPARWPRVVQLSGTLRALPPIFIACDVTNPLLGPRGAAAVYGPQKGLRNADVSRLDHECARLALMLCSRFGRPDGLMEAPGAGAAGGIAFGLMVGAGAQLVPGFDFVSRWLDLSHRIHAADVVITGEGRFDESSLQGKGPGSVAAEALAAGKPVHVFAGQVTATQHPPGLSWHGITPPGLPLDRALREAGDHLGRAIHRTFAKT